MSKDFPTQIDRGAPRRRRQLGLSWFALICASVAWGTVGAGCAGTVSSSGWIRLQTARFEFISSVDADETRQFAEQLEQFLDVVAYVVPMLEIQLRQPMRVYVFSDRKALNRIRPHSKAAGYFHRREDTIHIAIDASDTEKSLGTVYVGLVHFALAHEAPRSFPPWYTEGITEFLGTTRSSQDAVWVGDISEELATWIHHASPLPLRLVMTVSDIRGWSAPARARFRAQSWALVHFFNTAHLAGPFPTGYSSTPRVISTGRVSMRPVRRRNATNVWKWSSDFDDTVIEAELLAARKLLEQLDPDTTRVAVIAFAGKARVLSQLTTPDEALKALDRYEVHLDWGGTNPTSALLEAIDIFAGPGRSNELRQRTVLLLSDGQLPNSRGKLVREHTLRAARLLGQFGIRAHTFSLGSSMGICVSSPVRTNSR